MRYFEERNEVIENYSLALFETAKENGYDIVEVIKDLEFFNKSLVNNESRELKKLLYYPLISVEEKVKKIHDIFDDSLEKIVVDFIIALTEEQRISFLELIVNEVKMIHRLDNNIINVKAKFGMEPSNEDIENIVNKLESKLNCKKIDFEFIVDEKLIGGVKLFYNGKYIDNTLLSKISRFTKQIKS